MEDTLGNVSESWKKNLYAIVVAEFLVLIGFSFVQPFMPLFIQEIGNYTNRETAFWAGIATGITGIVMFFSAPLWGIVADRWGRKPMVLRAQFGSAIVLALMGLSPNVPFLIGMRFVQGLLSGTVAAASALVVAFTPTNRMPYAMGLLMLATFSGASFGPALGGIIADVVGYRATFFITGGLLVAGGFIVLFLVEEKFERPAAGKGTGLGSILSLVKSREMLPLLLAICILHASPQMISTIVPLFIRNLNPAIKAATASGLAFSLMCVLAAISSVVAGRLGGRISLKKMLVFSCLISGFLYLPPIWAATVTQLIIFIALTGLFQGGFTTSVNTLVSLSAPREQQGVAYGIAQSANALGSGLGPLIGGVLTALLGFKPVFAVAGGLFMLVSFVVYKNVSGVPSSGKDTPGTRWKTVE
jgi:DHA1 family multidrug resistance protein-like MFS transporter